jgi:hypothetical protein
MESLSLGSISEEMVSWTDFDSPVADVGNFPGTFFASAALSFA